MDQPQPVTGGFLHRMYAVETTRGKYAVKALNPQIMRRPNVLENIINAESVATIAVDTVTAIPARIYNGNIVHKIDNQFFIVFDWVEGKSLRHDEIQIIHCKKIGSILADIHTIDFSKANIHESSDRAKPIDWHFYVRKGLENDAVWSELLAGYIEDIYIWADRAVKAARRLASDKVISHRDLDPKNVLWSGDAPYLIDWESSGYISPSQELTETAVYWSLDGNGDIDRDKFMAFIRAYHGKYLNRNDWKTALDNSFLGKLEWLEYNMKRSLWIECSDEEEQQMGTAQVTETLRAIARYADRIPVLERWLTESSDV